MRTLILAALVWPALAAAQELRPERLYLPSGVLLGSTRVVALGGAYVGVAEGVSGFASNLAALAHRAPHLERDWDVGFTFSWLDLPFASPKNRDLDNDGFADQALGTRQLLTGILLQYKRFGIGWYMRSSSLAYCAVSLFDGSCPGSEWVSVDVANTALAAAVALGRDDFIASLGLYGAEASFSHHRESRKYTNTGVEFDVLYRPHGLSYRLGVSVKPLVVAPYRPQAEGEQPMLAGRTLHAAVVSPAVLSLGGSLKLGEGRQHYNRLSTAARRDVRDRFGDSWVPPEEERDVPDGDWLVTGQLDLISAVEGATPLASFTDLSIASGQASAPLIGNTTYLVPRLGVEHHTLRQRLRTRLGSYVEPSPYAQTLPRPHLTGGAELFVWEYWEKWALSTSFDFATRYYNVGLSLGFWR
ncbi:MAG: hypothetical protein ACOZIN_22480 [Myxococcota bacterium]